MLLEADVSHLLPIYKFYSLSDLHLWQAVDRHRQMNCSSPMACKETYSNGIINQ